MVVAWKVVITIFIVYAVATDANRARRRRRYALNANSQSNLLNSKSEGRQQALPPNPQILNAEGQSPLNQINQGGVGQAKAHYSGSGHGSRQYYPSQNQYGYGGQQGGQSPGGQFPGGQYNPYGGMGSGYQSNYGQYGQYGQGIGSYGSYSNQNPGYNSFYSGYNSGGYQNRPGYSSNYNPSYGGYSGGYFWNNAQQSSASLITVLLSSLFSLFICLILM